MNRLTVRTSAAAAVACLVLGAAAGPVRANDAGSPRVVIDGNNQIVVYQPQPELASADELRSARIVVATEPTELVVVQGEPDYVPLEGGAVLYVSNSESDLFLEVATQRNFLLISGRWYAAQSRKGPWTFIAPGALPKDFARIPENGPKAHVLAFVPGAIAPGVRSWTT